jgi:DNA-binding GntR family transcriptional regulator
MAVGMQFQRESAYKKLLALLLAGRLPMGAPLSERPISAVLGLGRPQARQAIKTLARGGLLGVAPTRGTLASSTTDEELRELYDERYALENKAAELAARAGASREPLKFERRLDESRHAYSDAEWDSTPATSADFHVAVFKSASNTIMPTRLGRYYRTPWVVDGSDQRLEILDASKADDATLAGAGWCVIPTITTLPRSAF